MKKIITLLVLVIVLACGDKSKNAHQNKKNYMQPTSTGRINHVVIVVSPDVWKGKVGKALQKVIQTPIEGLPQEEYQFNVSTIPPKAFNKMFKNSRNLLVLQLADKTVFKISKNRYAQPQTILEVKARTEADLMQLIHQKKMAIIDAFKSEDLKSIQKENLKNLYTQKINTLNSLGVTMDIPKKYRMVMDTLNTFVWMRSSISGGLAIGDQTNNIIVYTAPMLEGKTPVLSEIIKNRDRIGKAFIRGNNVDKMYMITEKARTPTIKEVTINGKKAFETRGTWEVFGAFNAGPFLNYTVIDEENNRLLVFEGFNYAPSVNKRDFMFELEAILKTIQFN